MPPAMPIIGLEDKTRRMQMAIQIVNPLAIRKGAKASKVKSAGGYSNFDVMMDAVGAAQLPAATAMGMYGGSNSSSVLAAAFSGVNAYRAQTSGGGAPYLASGAYGGLHNLSGGVGGEMLPGGSSSVVPGTDYSQTDMINQMNQNNLQLLGLQATLQSNMQAWNTKSNILSADHRAKMAMIEKFTARG